MVALGLSLAHEVLEAPLPDSVQSWISSQRVVASLSVQVRSRLFAEENPSRVEDDLFLLQAIEHFSGQLAYSLHLAVTPSSKERALIPLPASLNFLWYFIRPVRLLTKYSWKVITSPINMAGQTFARKETTSSDEPSGALSQEKKISPAK
jgi:hypothetical protein